MKSLSLDNSGEAVRKITEALSLGEIVASPTDTVYGFLADALSPQAVERVFEVKQRQMGKALSVFVKDVEMAETLAVISPSQREFLLKSWPGKVTVIMKAKREIPGLTQDGKIGLRIPKYDLIRKILEQYNQPLTGTSANVSGFPECRSAGEVLSQFQGRKEQPDIVVDGGELPFSETSTVVDITEKEQKILRKGA